MFLPGDDAGREMLLLHPRWDGEAMEDAQMYQMVLKVTKFDISNFCLLSKRRRVVASSSKFQFGFEATVDRCSKLVFDTSIRLMT